MGDFSSSEQDTQIQSHEIAAHAVRRRGRRGRCRHVRTTEACPTSQRCLLTRSRKARWLSAIRETCQAACVAERS